MEIPQPEIVGDDLTVDVEVLSAASFALSPHEFFELGYIPSGSGSADLTISGGLAPYTYSITMTDYYYYTNADLEGYKDIVSDDGVIELRDIVGTSNDVDLYTYGYHPFYTVRITDANNCTLFTSFNIPYRYEEISLSSTKLIDEIYLDDYTDGLSNGIVSATANTDAPAVLEFKKETDSEWEDCPHFSIRKRR